MRRILNRVCGSLQQYWRLFALLGLVAFALSIAVTLPTPITLASVSLQAERVVLTIDSASALEISLPEAWIENSKECSKGAITILAQPGAKVAYERVIGGALNIYVEGKTSWSNDSALLGQSTGTTRFRMGSAADNCKWSGSIRLPIYGQMVVGTPFGGPMSEPGLPILDGQLRIFARTIGSIWGDWIALKRVALMEPDRLYLAQTLDLGSGMQLVGATLRRSGHPEIPSSWHGFTDVDLSAAGASERGMRIEASADASTVEFLLPVAMATSNGSMDQRESFSLTLAARLTGDPNLTWVFSIIAALVAGLSMFGTVLSMAHPRKPASATASSSDSSTQA